MNKPTFIVIHCSAIKQTQVNPQFDRIKRGHIRKGWGDIGYHYVIEANGEIVEGRDEKKAGAHTKQNFMNYRSIGICLAGWFDVDVEEPTPEQLASLQSLTHHLMIKYSIDKERVRFHREWATYKTCPGSWWTRVKLLDLLMLRELIRSDNGGFYFVKKKSSGIPDGKQKIPTNNKGVGGLLTVISRQFGVETKSQKELDKIKDKNYF